MAIETLIKTTFSDAFRDEIWQELTAGRLLSPEFKKNIQYGDEVNVQFDGSVIMEDYAGGDLSTENVLTADTTTVKIKINKGKSVIFKLDEAKIRQIENAKNDAERVKLAKAYGEDAREQFARAVNKACCEQYVRAGHVITSNDDGTTAITITTENIKNLFAKAKAVLKQGDNKHTAWKSGEMIAVIDTDMEAFMSTQGLLQYSDTMAKHFKNGFSGTFMGFNVLVDDEIVKDAQGNKYPLFGREKKTIAGGIQDEFKLKSDVKVGGFDTYYWGKGVFGVKAPLSYLLATAKVKADFVVA